MRTDTTKTALLNDLLLIGDYVFQAKLFVSGAPMKMSSSNLNQSHKSLWLIFPDRKSPRGERVSGTDCGLKSEFL